MCLLKYLEKSFRKFVFNIFRKKKKIQILNFFACFYNGWTEKVKIYFYELSFFPFYIALSIKNL